MSDQKCLKLRSCLKSKEVQEDLRYVLSAAIKLVAKESDKIGIQLGPDFGAHLEKFFFDEGLIAPVETLPEEKL